MRLRELLRLEDVTAFEAKGDVAAVLRAGHVERLDLATGVRRALGRVGEPARVALSACGLVAAADCRAGAVQVFDGSGAARALPRIDAFVTSLAVSEDGAVAAGAEDERVRVSRGLSTWERSFALSRVPENLRDIQTPGVAGLRFRSDGVLVALSGTGVLHASSPDAAERWAHETEPPGEDPVPIFFLGGERVAVQVFGALVVIDGARGVLERHEGVLAVAERAGACAFAGRDGSVGAIGRGEIGSVAPAEPRALVWAPDGTLLVGIDEGRMVTLGGEELESPLRHEPLALHAAGDRLLVLGLDGDLVLCALEAAGPPSRVRRAPPALEPDRVIDRAGVGRVAFSPAGDRVALVGAGRVEVHDVDGGTELAALALGDPQVGFAVSAWYVGDRLVVRHDTLGYVVLDGASLREVARAPTERGPMYLVGANARWALFRHVARLELLDLAAGTCTAIAAGARQDRGLLYNALHHVEATADVSRVVALPHDAAALLLALPGGEVLARVPRWRYPAFDPSGELLVEPGSGQLLDARTGALLRTLPRSGHRAIFSPDGARFAVLAERGDATLYDRLGEPVVELAGPVLRLVFVGDRFVLTREDGAYLHDGSGGARLARLHGHARVWSGMAAVPLPGTSRLVEWPATLPTPTAVLRMHDAEDGHFVAALFGHRGGDRPIDPPQPWRGAVVTPSWGAPDPARVFALDDGEPLGTIPIEGRASLALHATTGRLAVAGADRVAIYRR